MRRRGAAKRKNPGKIRPYNAKPNAAYLKAFAAEYNRISRAAGGHDADVSKYGNFGENGSAHWNYLRPFYQMGATAVEAARFAAADQRDPYYWKFHAETEPLLPEIPKIKAWTYAMRNEYGRGYQRWSQKFLDEAFKEHLERTTQSMAREAQEERIRIEKRDAFLAAHRFARGAISRLRSEAATRAFLEASRLEREAEMGPSSYDYFAPDDREAARRRGAGLEINGRRGRRPSRRQLALGIREEREHDDVTGGDPRLVRRIALAHLREDPRYYTKLARCFRKRRKNPARSARQRRLFGTALGCRRTGRCRGARVRRLARLPLRVLREYARKR